MIKNLGFTVVHLTTLQNKPFVTLIGYIEELIVGGTRHIEHSISGINTI